MSTLSDAGGSAFTPDRAGGTERARAAATGRAPRRWWPWVLLVLVALFVAGFVAGAMLLAETLGGTLGGLDIRIDGERLLTLPDGEADLWGVAAMVLLVVMPLALLLALLVTVVLLAVLLLMALAMGALALSPLGVIALLLWWALREPRPAAPPSRSD